MMLKIDLRKVVILISFHIFFIFMFYLYKSVKSVFTNFFVKMYTHDKKYLFEIKKYLLRKIY